MITLLLLQAAFGLVGPFNKYAVSLCPVYLFTGLKLSLAGIILLLFARMRYGISLYIPREQRLGYGAIILFGMFGSHVLKYWGLQYISPTKVAFIYTVSPLFVAGLSSFYLKYRLSIRQYLGLGVSFGAIFPLLFNKEIYAELLLLPSWPEWLVLIAVFFHAISMLSKQTLVKKFQANSLVVNGICMFSGGVIALIFSVLFQEQVNYESIPQWITALLGTMFLSKVICSSLHLYLMKFYSITFLALMDYWYPFFVAFWSWVFYGESLPSHLYVLSLLMFVGQVIFYSDELHKSGIYITAPQV